MTTLPNPWLTINDKPVKLVKVKKPKKEKKDA